MLGAVNQPGVHQLRGRKTLAEIISMAGGLKQDAVIVVSGLPRSGTSVMMQMLDAAGVPVLTDNIRTPDVDNPKGYYEFEAVKQVTYR